MFEGKSAGQAEETVRSRHSFIPGAAMISRQTATQESSTMNRIIRTIVFALSCMICLAPTFTLAAQNAQAQLAQLNSLQEKIKDPDTRTRVSAFHQVWTIGLASDSSDVKTLALDLMKEPVASASDHIRMPAVYAIAEIANSSVDPAVKSKALADLKEPIVAGQLPIRLAAIDAVNSIMRQTPSSDLALQAIQLLGEPLRSGNNGVRIPAINAVAHIALGPNDDHVISVALDMLQAPLDSMAAIGGMEVRLMAVAEIEKLGVAATDTATKAKALAMLQASANNGTWEPEARSRAAEGAARIQGTMKEASPTSAPSGLARLSVSSTPAGADIEVDGSFVGNTPSDLSIAEGDHTVQIHKSGFKPWERKLKATAGSTVRINAELEKAPEN
jgi:PEGA domain